MGEITSISWADATYNPWIGCEKVSPACDGCYAEQLMDHRFGRAHWGAGNTRVEAKRATFLKPYRWNAAAAGRDQPPFVFCLSLGDIFDRSASPDLRARAFHVMRETPNLLYLLLTKRPHDIIPLSVQAGGLPTNVALGTSCEDQPWFDRRVPHLREAKAALRPAFVFLSIEPFLGEIDGTAHLHDIEWVITGGGTDQGAYKAPPLHPRWALSLRDQCAAAGTVFHHKHNGEWLSAPVALGLGLTASELGFPWIWGPRMARVGRKHAGRRLGGVIYDARPVVPSFNTELAS